MIFRSEFVKQHKHAGRRQQELSVMAACAWRTLGTDGQTEWYEKAALAKGKHDIKNPELKAPRQRPKPYRPRVNARDVAHTDAIHPVRETYATLSPSLSARRRMRKSVEQPIVPPSTLFIQDPIPIARSATFTSSSTLAHALHPPSFFAGHHYHRSEEVNTSVSAFAFHELHTEPILTTFDSPLQASNQINTTEAQTFRSGPGLQKSVASTTSLPVLFPLRRPLRLRHPVTASLPKMFQAFLVRLSIQVQCRRATGAIESLSRIIILYQPPVTGT